MSTSEQQGALEWLYGLADQERGVGWNPRASPASQWKLGRTRTLLDLSGAPDRRLRIALIAGTKGKGSTAAMLASILGMAGVRCGLYTKPHLQSYRERIRVDGAAIGPAAFSDAVHRMRNHVGRLPMPAGEPTTFEVTTALAFDVFAREACQMAVVEVGLGGRLDATNATDPFVSVVTSISYDHTAILGRTLAAIAFEKAGILRTGRPAVLAQQRSSAMRALLRACRNVGAECHVTPPLRKRVPLRGEHQRQNAALAVTTARIMCSGIDNNSVVCRGLQRLRWPGRFEVVGRNPPIVLDGAHNGASAEALAATLIDYAAGRPIALIVGINRDKDARAVLRPLVDKARIVWATQSADNPRALDPESLAVVCRGRGAEVRTAPGINDALQAATACSRGGVVCVTGSLMLVGQARDTLGLPVAEHLW